MSRCLYGQEYLPKHIEFPVYDWDEFKKNPKLRGLIHPTGYFIPQIRCFNTAHEPVFAEVNPFCPNGENACLQATYWQLFETDIQLCPLPLADYSKTAIIKPDDIPLVPIIYKVNGEPTGISRLGNLTSVPFIGLDRNTNLPIFINAAEDMSRKQYIDRITRVREFGFSLFALTGRALRNFSELHFEDVQHI